MRNMGFGLLVLLVIYGWGCILWGLWQWSPAFAMIVVGCLCLVIASVLLSVLVPDGKKT